MPDEHADDEQGPEDDYGDDDQSWRSSSAPLRAACMIGAVRVVSRAARVVRSTGPAIQLRLRDVMSAAVPLHCTSVSCNCTRRLRDDMAVRGLPCPAASRWGAAPVAQRGGARMTWSPGPVVTRRRLGGELKRLRDGPGLKLEDVARRLECSPSKISRLENGKGVPRSRDVRRHARVYGVPDGEKRDASPGAGRARARRRMWWQEYADVLAARHGHLRRARVGRRPHPRLRAASSCTVSCRRADYARAVLRGVWGGRVPDADDRADGRGPDAAAGRSERRARADVPRACSTSPRSTGSSVRPRSCAAQLEHLIDVAEAEHVDVRVLPFSAGLVPASRRLVRQAGVLRGHRARASSSSSGRRSRASSSRTRRRSPIMRPG